MVILATLVTLAVSPKGRAAVKACIGSCVEPNMQARAVVPSDKPKAPPPDVVVSPPGPVALSPMVMQTATPLPVQIMCPSGTGQAFYPPPNASVCACPFCGTHVVLEPLVG